VERERQEPARALGATAAFRGPFAAFLAIVLRLGARPDAPLLALPAPRRHGSAGRARRAPAPAPGLPARADEREHRVEEDVELGTIALVLHERRGERLTQDRALDPARGHGSYRVERLRDRDVHAARAQRLDEVEDAVTHPRRLAAYA
jgi:hypothetical protein